MATFANFAQFLAEQGVGDSFLGAFARFQRSGQFRNIGPFRSFDGPDGGEFFFDESGQIIPIRSREDSLSFMQLSIQAQQARLAEAETERLKLLFGGADESASRKLARRRREERLLRQNTLARLQSLGPVLLEAPT